MAQTTTESHERLAPLDFLRSCAILLVFLFHYSQQGARDWLRPFGQYGWAGVDLFFVLSGFLITAQLLKPITQGTKLSLKDFFIRRSLRIWPNYFVVVALYFLVPSFAEKDNLAPLWKFLTFTQNFNLSFGAFSHAWSLCIEEQFYLTLPFIVLFMGRFGTKVRASLLFLLLFIFGFTYRVYAWSHFVAPLLADPRHGDVGELYFKTIYYPTFGRLDGLLTGVSLASVYRCCPTLWAKITKLGDPFLMIGILLLSVAVVVCEDKTTFNASVIGFPLIAFGFGCILLAALSRTSVLQKLKFKAASWGATLAFSFYLIHKPIIHLCHLEAAQFGQDKNSVIVFICTTLVCIAGSLVLYFLIERPFLLFRDHLLAIHCHTSKIRMPAPSVKSDEPFPPA